MTALRLIYLDAGLVDELGHHANFCRAVTRECRARGIAVTTFANVRVTQDLAAEFGAFPLFRRSPYPIYENNPIAYWLNNFESVSETSLEDLRRIGGLAPGDIVYMNWAWPAHLMALIRWAATFSANELPTVVVEVGADPGLDAIEAVGGGQMRLMPRDLRNDARAVLYRYAARHLPRSSSPRLHFVTYDPTTSWAFQTLLDHPVKTLPVVFSALTTPRRRAGTRPITVSVLGHQRPEKGYGLMPDVAAALLHDGRDIGLLVHNADPGNMASVQNAMRSLAARDARVRLDERVAGQPLWAELLDRSDLVLCPYDPAQYKFAHSSVVYESLANAIPVVVPANTAISALLNRLGNPGTSFETFTALSIAAAVQRVLDEFDRYAELAYDTAKRWSETQGPRRVVQALLELAAT